MPFDFTKHRVYTIDYCKIFEEIMEQRVLANNDIQAQYLSQWMRSLKQHDNILLKQFGTKKDIMEFVVKMQSEPEIFQLPIHLKSDTLFLHFRVSIVNEISKDFYSQSEWIPIAEFQGNNQCIYWTKVEENVEGYAGCVQPIIAVPYFSGKYNWLVIDGNHRLTYSVNHNIASIRTLILSETSAIEQRIFSSSFDLMFYIFNNELVRFGNITAEGKENDLKLIKKSYLCGKGFQFGNE